MGPKKSTRGGGCFSFLPDNQAFLPDAISGQCSCPMNQALSVPMNQALWAFMTLIRSMTLWL